MPLDLSSVTDTLTNLVKNGWSTAPIWSELGLSSPSFTPNFSGYAPDVVLKDSSGPQLSMYLYHIESNNALEAYRWTPEMLNGTQQPVSYLPLALDLYYLLYAISEPDYHQEQQAMSVAMRIYHASPIVRSDPTVLVPWELTLTMEHRSYDELSRLWQATTQPLRMSLVYRAAVVFIDPEQAPAAAKATTSFTVAAATVPLPLIPLPPPHQGNYPVAIVAMRQVTYVDQAGTTVEYEQTPASAAPGQTFWLVGDTFGTPGFADTVYLLPPGGGAEVDVTSWAAPAESSASKFVLTLPGTTGAAPAEAPDPGVYQLRVGSGTLGSPGAVRSNAVPVSIAALVSPAGGPVLSGAPSYVVNGQGFLAGQTEVVVGGTVLTVVAGAPSAGEVEIDPSGTAFTFAPPAGPAGTVLPLQVRVNNVESEPALWVSL